MNYGNFKDLPRRTSSDKVLRDKEFDIAKNPKYDECESSLASRVYKGLDQKPSGVAVIHALATWHKSSFKREIMINRQ